MENNKINIRNDEHYIDTTPYNALNNMQPKEGEIWMYGENGGTRYEREYLAAVELAKIVLKGDAE